MKSTEYWAAPDAVADAAADRFTELRAAYHARLRSEAASLLRLLRTLDATPSDLQLFEDVRRFAHRMAGAAAMFEAAGIADAAAALEAAASAARIAPDGVATAAVRMRLSDLIKVVQGVRG